MYYYLWNRRMEKGLCHDSISRDSILDYVFHDVTWASPFTLRMPNFRKESIRWYFTLFHGTNMQIMNLYEMRCIRLLESTFEHSAEMIIRVTSMTKAITRDWNNIRHNVYSQLFLQLTSHPVELGIVDLPFETIRELHPFDASSRPASLSIRHSTF